jgi:hypothetical protein
MSNTFWESQVKSLEKMPTIHARHPSGFLIALDDIDRNRIDAAIDWLTEHGYTPDLPGDGWRRTPDGLPICGKHGLVMSRRERQGDEWFSHKVIDPHGQEKYCRGYPTSSESDGFHV